MPVQVAAALLRGKGAWQQYLDISTAVQGGDLSFWRNLNVMAYVSLGQPLNMCNRTFLIVHVVRSLQARCRKTNTILFLKMGLLRLLGALRCDIVLPGCFAGSQFACYFG